MTRRLVAVVAVAILHLVLTVYAYGEAEVTEPTETTMMWGESTKVLAFPLLSLFFFAERHVHIPRLAGMDWFPIAMILNSFFWGVVVVAAVVWVNARFTRREGPRRAE